MTFQLRHSRLPRPTAAIWLGECTNYDDRHHIISPIVTPTCPASCLLGYYGQPYHPRSIQPMALHATHPPPPLRTARGRSRRGARRRSGGPWPARSRRGHRASPAPLPGMPDASSASGEATACHNPVSTTYPLYQLRGGRLRACPERSRRCRARLEPKARLFRWPAPQRAPRCGGNQTGSHISRNCVRAGARLPRGCAACGTTIPPSPLHAAPTATAPPKQSVN